MVIPENCFLYSWGVNQDLDRRKFVLLITAPDRKTADQILRNNPLHYPFVADQVLNDPKKADRWSFRVEKVALCGSFKSC